MAGSELILVVDDDRAVAEAHAAILTRLKYTPIVETSPLRAEALVSERPEIALVLLDMRMPELDGIEMIRRLKCRRPEIGIVIATVVNDLEQAILATKLGAFNYLLKPVPEERLERVLESFFESRSSFFRENDPRFSSFITGAPCFKEIFSRAVSFAEAGVNVLICGETGTGKELMAQIIHASSRRADKQFLPVNVGALTRELFESELFGHRKGAFTGAMRDHDGYFGEVGSGTLFMDEIGELDLDQQKKLLRVLQSGTYSRVGETKQSQIEAGLLFATNLDMARMVQRGRFRADLYYRLCGHSIELPPLRNRPGDIGLLSRFFIAKYNSQYGRFVEGIRPDAVSLLESYPFPGNVRELEGIISASVLLETEAHIRVATLPAHLHRPSVVADRQEESFDLRNGRSRMIVAAMEECGGNQTRAAEKLGIARGTLNRLLKSMRERQAAPGSD